MTAHNKDVFSLIDRIIAHYRNTVSGDEEIRKETARVLSLLEHLPSLSEDFNESRHPVVAHVDEALTSAEHAYSDFTAAIRPAIRYLPWKYNYAPRKDKPSLGSTIGFAEIIGPEAPLRSDKVCLGLTLIAPDTLYPLHHHPAVELYYVIGGNAVWTKKGIARLVPPGEYVLHESNVIHSMETGSEALLALYAWTGDDVITISVYDDIAAEEKEKEKP
jgi:quercetin dioxygenase-like cupin family protein